MNNMLVNDSFESPVGFCVFCLTERLLVRIVSPSQTALMK